MSQRVIELRGVAVNNLRHVDLDLPHRQLIVFCGVSGSGKTSLALDTLYAEGQRRYIESFSAYTRQFLEQLDKPEAERIDGIPPAIAVTHKNPSRSNRATVGTTTEVNDYLSLLFARVGEVICYRCGRPVRRDSPESAAEALAAAAGRHAADDRVRGRRAERRAGRARGSRDLIEQRLRAGDRRRAHGDDRAEARGAAEGRASESTIVLDRLDGGRGVGGAAARLAGDRVCGGRRRVRGVGGGRAESAEAASGGGADRWTSCGGGWRSARRCAARSAGSIIRSRSRSCSISTGRWGRARSAKDSATS